MVWTYLAESVESQSHSKTGFRPVAYCEIDPYCQGVLLSKMDRSKITRAPIWDDVRTLNRESGTFLLTH